MRARKAVILLALTALTALTMFFVMLADSAAIGAVVDQDRDRFRREWSGPDGKTEVEVSAEWGDGGVGDLRPPLTGENARDFAIPFGPACVRARVSDMEGE